MHAALHKSFLFNLLLNGFNLDLQYCKSGHCNSKFKIYFGTCIVQLLDSNFEGSV